ncbi:MAG: VWA domain-containing protein [Phycisphaerales bacterium]|nr:MAG: VWA domain-containing protein [Phycisphaerales bacterium]
MDWVGLSRFAPGALFGALCVAFALAAPLVWFDRRSTRRRPSLRFSSAAPLRGLGHTWRTRTAFVIPLLRSFVLLTLIFALARPQSGGAVRDTSEGIAIDMVLDVSGSMAETDFLVDRRPARRLDAVKKVFHQFVVGEGKLAGRPNDLIGMTTFAMYADEKCPLTLDHANLVDLLRETEIPGWVRGVQKWEHPEAGNTALGDAIVLSTDRLRRAGEKAAAQVPGAEAARSRVMILLTDGADNPAPQLARDAPDPIEAARLAAKLGIKIYTIGAAGTESPRSSDPFARLLLAGRRAEVDEESLKRIADVTGGRYFRATDTESLETIYDEIDKLERRVTGERIYNDNVRAAQIAMLLGLGLLLLELTLSRTVYRRSP